MCVSGALTAYSLYRSMTDLPAASQAFIGIPCADRHEASVLLAHPPRTTSAYWKDVATSPVHLERCGAMVVIVDTPRQPPIHCACNCHYKGAKLRFDKCSPELQSCSCVWSHTALTYNRTMQSSHNDIHEHCPIDMSGAKGYIGIMMQIVEACQEAPRLSHAFKAEPASRLQNVHQYCSQHVQKTLRYRAVGHRTNKQQFGLCDSHRAMVHPATRVCRVFLLHTIS